MMVQESPSPNLTTFFRKAFAFLKRDALDSLSYKMSALFNLGAIVAQILAFFFISQLVDGSTEVGHTYPLLNQGYFPFVLIGIAMVGFQATGLSSFAQSIQKEQGAGTLEAILITPTSLTTVMLVGSFWHFILMTTRVVFLLCIGAWLFGVDFSAMNFVSFMAVIFLTILALSGVGIFSAGFILAYKQNSPLNFFMNGLSKLLAGVYFPIALLPDWIEKSAFLLPLTHSLSATRKALLQGATFNEIQSELSVLFLFSIILLPAGIFFFRWGLRKAKRDGSLTFY